MKKTLRVFGIIAVVICLILSIVACVTKEDENYIDVIAVSESEYASAEDALKGYVKEELAFSVNYGDEVNEVVVAQYVSHESKGAVAGSAMKLSEEQQANFVSAEKFAVKVKVALAPDEDEEADFSEATQTVYVLKYGEKYKFMVSKPIVGERLTNSYAATFTDEEKYENCTLLAAGIIKEPDDEEAAFDSAYEFRFTTEAACRIVYYDETRFNTRTPGKDEKSGDRITYTVMKDESIAEVSNVFNENEEIWKVNVLDGKYINTIKDYNKNTIKSNLLGVFIQTPAALYTVTEKGFEFKIEINEEDGDKEIYEYSMTVADGKITSLTIAETYSWLSEDGNKTYVSSMESNVKLIDFGTTTVSVPEAVTDALN